MCGLRAQIEGVEEGRIKMHLIYSDGTSPLAVAGFESP